MKRGTSSEAVLEENDEAGGFEKVGNRNVDYRLCGAAHRWLVSRKRPSGDAARVTPYYYNPYIADQSGLSWYAVRAYYAGGPWCGVAGGAYSPTVGVFGRASYTCYSGWDDYKPLNGIGCDPGTLIKGGDGIMYVCQ